MLYIPVCLIHLTIYCVSLYKSSSQTLAPFWKNAIEWLDEGRNGVIGVAPGLNSAFNLFNKSGFKCEKTKFREDLSVFVCTAYSEEHIEEIQDFVAEGGGLLIGGHAWYWAQTHHGQNTMTDFSGKIACHKYFHLMYGTSVNLSQSLNKHRVTAEFLP